MSGVLRRGSLSFDANLNGRSKRGCNDSNLYGGYHEHKRVRTPEISVISFDFRRHSQDLKKDTLTLSTAPDLSDDIDSDIISNYVGHYEGIREKTAYTKQQKCDELNLSNIDVPPFVNSLRNALR
ncbi:hypothetical protein GQX74_004958 [Glossina fuscipes]|nr:hypothetical protein GQX74_004958 [Glossina fuscipes]